MAVAGNPPLQPAQSGVQQEGHHHQRGGAQQDHGHVPLADGGVEQAAQAAAPHEGGEDRRPDGVDRGDADACQKHGDGQGDLDVEQAVGRGHPHAGGRLLHVLGHLGQAQGAVAHDGQQGVEGQTHHGGGGAGVQHHHDKAQQGQGGDGLDQVHHPEDDLPQPGEAVGDQAQGDPHQNGQKQGGQHQGQVVPDQRDTHLSPPPFRRPRGTTWRCSRSTSPPSTSARMAAGMAPCRISCWN